MTDADLRQQVLDALSGVAPEADLADLDGEVPFRDQLDLDSMDFLNFLIKVAEGTGVEMPERDYPKVATLDDLVAYLEAARSGA